MPRSEEPSVQQKVKKWKSVDKPGFDNYRGLLNDCIICLVLSNFHNILRNFEKYGLLIDPREWVYAGYQTLTVSMVILLSVLWVFPVMTFILEKLASKGILKEKILLILQTCNLLVFIAVPPVVSFVSKPGPAMCSYSIVWMKLVSYCQVNKWCREAKETTPNDKDKKSSIVCYPDNLNIKDFCYFLIAPTLCYELNFPRTPKIRKIFLIRRTLESIFLCNILLALSQQWLAPTVLGSVEPFQKMDFTVMIQRILLLAVSYPIICCGCCCSIFTSIPFSMYWRRYCGLVTDAFTRTGGMLTAFPHFGDIGMFQYIAGQQELGYTKITSQVAVFLLSAFFHEYCVSIPLKMLRVWAFTAMLGQIPLAVLTSLDVMRGQPGNVVVWVSIILGQPIAILMYMHDYYLMYY